ncbi:hypothetical protein BH09CHL1_BH09CHL1_23340 [soil metagenome]
MVMAATTTQRLLRERELPIARLLWIALIGLGALFFVKGAPIIHDQILTPCSGDGCMSWQRSDTSGFSRTLFADMYVGRESALFLLCVCISALIVWKAGNDRVAWLGAIMLVCFGGAVSPDTVYALGQSSVGWRIPVETMSLIGGLTFVVFLYVFPNGRITPTWGRWLLATCCAYIVIGYVAPRESMFNYYSDFTLLMILITIVVAIVLQIIRYRSYSNTIQKLQSKWVLLGFGGAAFGVFIAVFPFRMMVHEFVKDRRPYAFAGMTFVSLSLMLIPLSIGLAMIRYRLWDVDLFLNRALVSTLLTVNVVVFYVGVVAGAGALLSSRGSRISSFVATAIVAICFQPMREHLQAWVNRLMYGDRDTPYSALSRLGQRLGAALTPDAVLPSIVESVAQALKSPYAAIALNRGQMFEVVASTGAVSDSALAWPLINQQEIVGELRLAPRSPGEQFSAADRRLIDDIAHQAGIAVQAVRLTADLQRSRERLVNAREEERRRLRRDLHDGLGPQLASQMLTLDAARRLRATDPAAADALLDELRGHIQTAVADIRTLVYELRPPALDDLGLIPALREHVRRFAESGLRIEIDSVDHLANLPAAVEVAIYRIVLEAMTNIVRHSGANQVTITIRTYDLEENRALRVEIVDDGRGIGNEVHAGVGMHSMRERAEELGGQCSIEQNLPGGTRVIAEFPLREDA